MSPERRRLHFEKNLEALEHSALGGLDLVLAQLDRALDALRRHDLDLAATVLAGAGRLDRHYFDVHGKILALLALQAPVASDLRLVAALLHLIKHVERMGDQCVNVAKLIPLSGERPPADHELLARLVQMGAVVRAQVVRCRIGFSERDIAGAIDLVELDRDVDRLDRDIFRRAIDVGDDVDAREWALAMVLVSRALERIGNNAVDVGEQTAFVVTGLFREFAAGAPDSLRPQSDD